MTTRTTVRRFAALAGTTLATLGMSAGIAAATEITKVDGNPRCADVQGSQSLRGVKIDPVRQGTTAFNGGSISVSDVSFSFAVPEGVSVIIVKGGPNANVYRWSSEQTSGSGLHAPINPSNGRPYGLSHIDFCFDSGSTPATPPSDPCAADPTAMKADGTPCTPVVITDPCAGNPGGTMANGQPCTPPKDPCLGNPGAMRADGSPCTVEERQQILDGPVYTVVVERSEAAAPARRVDAPQGGVLGAVGTVDSRSRIAANASMRGLKSCVTRPFSAVVQGRGIKRVTLYVNGRKVRTYAGGRTRYDLRVNPASARKGVLRVQARVEFVAASGKQAQTLRMTALRCASAVAPVRFAG